jgi:hypothetical protein
MAKAPAAHCLLTLHRKIGWSTGSDDGPRSQTCRTRSDRCILVSIAIMTPRAERRNRAALTLPCQRGDHPPPDRGLLHPTRARPVTASRGRAHATRTRRSSTSETASGCRLCLRKRNRASGHAATPVTVARHHHLAGWRRGSPGRSAVRHSDDHKGASSLMTTRKMMRLVER